jgi:hypothetical protein
MSRGLSGYGPSVAPTQEQLDEQQKRLDELRKQAAETDRRIDALLRHVDLVIAEARRVQRRLEARL